MWTAIRKFFRDSETIFLARLQMVVGFIAVVAGGLDWSPLITLAQGGGFDQRQIVSLAVVLLVQGVVTEWARRRRDPELGND